MEQAGTGGDISACTNDPIPLLMSVSVLWCARCSFHVTSETSRVSVGAPDQRQTLECRQLKASIYAPEKRQSYEPEALWTEFAAAVNITKQLKTDNSRNAGQLHGPGGPPSTQAGT